LIILFVLLCSSLPAPVMGGPPGAPVDPFILEEMAASPDGTAGYFVLFRQQADLSPAYALNDWNERGRRVYQTLWETAERSQFRVRRWLEERGLPYTALPINNSLFVTTDRATLEALASFPEVAGFRGNHRHELEPRPAGPEDAFPQGVAWNIAQVGADQVWRDYRVKGQGITVASIDTGVEYTHDALFPNYKCGNGPHTPCWHDPSSICPDPAVPCDNVGHGTHTMGTMVGDDNPALRYNVGMAPDAQWITCKGCEDYWCSDYALTACANWLLAPGGDPDNRPHVVNNSWGGYGCDTWYRPLVQAWRAAGIFPAFAAGNSGPGCSTLISPGDYPESFAAGATDSSDQIAYFSSRGPSCWGEIKPEVVAPGVSICSSVPGNTWDCSYSGTSMASPHVAGLVALLWSADPDLIGNLDATEYAITSTAVCRSDTSCGGEACHNNVYGWGRIDAYLAVQMVASAGTLAGTVWEAGTGEPLPGVRIVATRRTLFSRETSTDATGAYSLTLPAGTYTVSVSLYGYYPQTATGVLIFTDTTTVQNFTLQAKPRYVISGTVSEAESGLPLEARIAAEGAPIPPVWSDPATGFYSLTLVEGTYPVRATSLLHLSERASVVADHNQTVNFVLEKGSCALLVDDDADLPDVRAYYTATLDALGVPYRVWDVARKGRPVAEDLLGHWIVFWWTGNDRGEVLSAEDEDLLAGYLDARGNLFLSSQDYLETGAPSRFQQDYLHISPIYTLNTGQTDPVGNGDDLIGRGLGPYLLVPPPGWSGPLHTDDVTNDGFGGASSPFRWQGTGQDNSTDYDGGSFKTVFLAWPFEALSGPASRRAVLQAALDFYGGCRPTGLLLGRVVDANTGEPLEGASVIPVPEGGVAAARPEGKTGAQGHFTFTLPAGSYELTVYQPGYEVEVLSAISVPAASVVRLEIALRAPRLSYAPESFSWTMLWEETATTTLVLSNTGTAGPLEWSLWVGGGQAAGQPPLKAHAPGPRLAGQSPVDRPPPGLGRGTSPGPQGPGWSYEPSLPGSRYRSASFSWEGWFYVVGGWGYEDPLDENLRYDSATGTWTAMTPLPVRRTNMQAAVVNDIAYLPGGYSGDFYESSLLAYDLVADAWLEGLEPLPEPRSGAMVAAVNGLVYACGGWPGPSDRCWAYDPAADHWREIAPMPDINGYGVALEHDGFLYILGGIHSCSCSYCNLSRAFWRYDPQTDSWEEGTPLNEGRMSPAAAVYGDDLYVVGGGGLGGDIWQPYDTVERYSLAEWPAGTWEILPETLPTPVVAPAGGCTADRIRIAGGLGEYYDLRAEHQALDEGRSCYEPPEWRLPWLTASPLSGTLAVGERATVTLRVDAGAVPDPGCYAATLSIRNNTVYGAGRVPATLCVQPTADLGLLAGTVRGLGYCDQEPAPLRRTDVRIEGPGGLTWTVATDGRGNYHRWLHAGTYTVTVGAPDYLTQTAVVAVGPAQTTTLNFDLRYLTPCLQLAPVQVTVYVPTETQAQVTLTLRNHSVVPLDWQAQEAFFPAGFFGPRGNALGHRAGPMRSGGPDPFGYTFVDSTEERGPTFDWLEVARPENRLPFSWGGYATITLPFTFTFYGVTHPPTTTLNLNVNGYISLKDYAWLWEECLPMEASKLLLPFWDWLNTGEKGGIYAQVLGTAPHRVLVIEWHEMLLDWPTGTVTLEALLFEGTNDILFQYRDVTTGGPYPYGNAGADAAVGIQKDAGVYLQYSCNEAVLTDSLAICFEPPGSLPGCGAVWEDVPWLEVSPSSGGLAGDAQATVRLLLDTAGLSPGVYRAAVGFLSNDSRRPAVYVPVTMVVGLNWRVYLPLVSRGP